MPELFSWARVLRYSLAFVLLGLSIGAARAQNDSHATFQEAYIHAAQFPNAASACNGYSGEWTRYLVEAAAWVEEKVGCMNGPYQMGAHQAGIHTFGGNYPGACPSGETRDPATAECVDPNEACRDLNAEPGRINVGPETRGYTSQCMKNGCVFGLTPGTGTGTCVSGMGASGCVYQGMYEWLGACPSAPAPDALTKEEAAPSPTPPQACVPVAGQTMCVKNNGEHCASASTGRQICWKPGETGVKTDGPVIQSRAAGTNPPPTPTPPPGETLNPPQPPITTTTTKPGGTTIIATTQTTTTTNGTNGGSTDDGEPATGAGSGDGPAGSPGGATGGETCAAPPSCTNPSTDATACTLIINTWYLRCKGVDLTGGDTCASPPVCVGNAGDCHIGKTLWHMRCDGDTPANTAAREGFISAGTGLDAAANETPGEVGSDLPNGGDPFGDGGRETRGNNWMLDKIDATGFLTGSAACPTMEPFHIGGSTFPLPLNMLCDLAASIGTLLVAFSYLMAFRIMAGQK